MQFSTIIRQLRSTIRTILVRSYYQSAAAAPSRPLLRNYFTTRAISMSNSNSSPAVISHDVGMNQLEDGMAGMTMAAPVTTPTKRGGRQQRQPKSAKSPANATSTPTSSSSSSYVSSRNAFNSQTRFARPPVTTPNPTRSHSGARHSHHQTRQFSTPTSSSSSGLSAAALEFTPNSKTSPATPGSATSASSVSSPAPYTPGSSLTSKPYFESELRPNDARGYRAAGIIAFRRIIGPDNKQQVQYLFGREGDSTNPKKFGKLNLLGGKIDERDLDAPMTAAREFFEESGALLSSPAELATNLKEQQHGVFWYRDGKYALYFLELTTPTEIGIVESYAQAKQLARNEHRQIIAEHSEMLELVWVDHSILSDALDSTFDKQTSEPNSLLTSSGQSHTMMDFTSAMLRKTIVRKKLTEIVTGMKFMAAKAPTRRSGDYRPRKSHPISNSNGSTSGPTTTTSTASTTTPTPNTPSSPTNA